MENEYVQVGIKSLVAYLSDSGVSYEKIAKMWGVSKLQIFNYAKGKTKRPSAQIAMSIYESTTFEGKPVVLDHYADLQHLENTYKMYQKGG